MNVILRIGIHHCHSPEEVLSHKLLLDTLLHLLLLSYGYHHLVCDTTLVNQASFLQVLLLRLLDHASKSMPCAMEGAILATALKACSLSVRQQISTTMISGICSSMEDG